MFGDDMFGDDMFGGGGSCVPLAASPAATAAYPVMTAGVMTAPTGLTGPDRSAKNPAQAVQKKGQKVTPQMGSNGSGPKESKHNSSSRRTQAKMMIGFRLFGLLADPTPLMQTLLPIVCAVFLLFGFSLSERENKNKNLFCNLAGLELVTMMVAVAIPHFVLLGVGRERQTGLRDFLLTLGCPPESYLLGWVAELVAVAAFATFLLMQVVIFLFPATNFSSQQLGAELVASSQGESRNSNGRNSNPSSDVDRSSDVGKIAASGRLAAQNQNAASGHIEVDFADSVNAVSWLYSFLDMDAMRLWALSTSAKITLFGVVFALLTFLTQIRILFKTEKAALSSGWGGPLLLGPSAPSLARRP